MIKTLTLATLLVFSVHGQSQALAFQVASIKPCPPGTSAPPAEHSGDVQWVYADGRFEAKATTVRFLMEWAYEIQPHQHSRGPAWTETDRYDILAKAEGNASEGEMRLMVRSLLAERFQLKLHTEKKDLPVFTLSLGKSAPKLFTPKNGEVHGLQMSRQMDPDQKTASYHIVATRFTLAQLADTFARQMERAMLNRTGLEGEFDFTLDLTPDETRPNVLDPSILITAMREQLGLTLKAETVSVDFLVVDGATKVEAGN